MQFKRGRGGPESNEWWFKTGLTLDDRQTDQLRVEWGLKELSARKGTRRKDKEQNRQPDVVHSSYRKTAASQAQASSSSRQPWQRARASTLPIVAVKAKR